MCKIKRESRRKEREREEIIFIISNMLREFGFAPENRNNISVRKFTLLLVGESHWLLLLLSSSASSLSLAKEMADTVQPQPPVSPGWISKYLPTGQGHSCVPSCQTFPASWPLIQRMKKIRDHRDSYIKQYKFILREAMLQMLQGNTVKIYSGPNK